MTCGGSNKREIDDLPALLKKRDFYLCGPCSHGKHRDHREPCECNDWNDAMHLSNVLAGTFDGLKFTGRLHMNDGYCTRCGAPEASIGEAMA